MALTPTPTSRPVRLSSGYVGCVVSQAGSKSPIAAYIVAYIVQHALTPIESLSALHKALWSVRQFLYELICGIRLGTDGFL